MNRYKVEEFRRELVLMAYTVRADSEEEAKELVDMGDYDGFDADECQDSILLNVTVTKLGKVPKEEADKLKAARGLT